MITIANPIYDTVFKRLMEDLEVARALVSCLLGLEVLELEPMPHEVTDYAAATPGANGSLVRIFRLDFNAIIQVSETEQKRVLIELQKASATDALGRFRNYLGRHYSQVDKTQPMLPLVAIYLLGFWIGKDLPPVLRVPRHYVDAVTGEAVTPATKNTFIESLTHDAVIVQIPGIPRLKGSTDLEAALRVFDQSSAMANPHFLQFAEGGMESAPKWFHRMVRVLQTAAADDSVRRDMAVEDEAASMLERNEELSALVMEERRQKEEERRQKEEERRQKELALERIQELERRLAGLDPQS
jgi:hypothetical protein